MTSSFNPTTSESDFRRFRQNDALYVDKSLFVRDIIRNTETSMVLLRPRRFGKTLNLSTLQYFFSNKETDINRPLFDGLAITQDKQAMAHFGHYPVIALTFKDIKEPTFSRFIENLQDKIASVYRQFSELLTSSALDAIEREKFKKILHEQASIVDLEMSLQKLSNWLHKHYQQPVFILLDEYDTPINESYTAQEPYYRECVDFMRTFLGAAFKGNNSMYKGIITGILQVGKESIFSDVNNLKIYSMLDDIRYSPYFGFTDEEIEYLVDQHDVLSMEEIRYWYNGYQIGDYRLYNPFSVMNAFHSQSCAPYWMNSSSNNLIRKVIEMGNESVKEDIAGLLQDGMIRKRVNIKTVFSDLHHPEVLWGLFVSAGYLSSSHREMDEDGNAWYQLSVPNQEVRIMYRQIVEHWFTDKNPDYYTAFLDSIIGENPELLERVLNLYLLESASFFDLNIRTPEKVYAAFMLGIVAGLKNHYVIWSNTEVGSGRCDVMISPKDKTKTGFIIEFKTCPDGDFATSQQKGFEQIEKKHYAVKLQSEGVQTIRQYAVSFYKQSARVEMR